MHGFHAVEVPATFPFAPVRLWGCCGQVCFCFFWDLFKGPGSRGALSEPIVGHSCVTGGGRSALTKRSDGAWLVREEGRRQWDRNLRASGTRPVLKRLFAGQMGRVGTRSLTHSNVTNKCRMGVYSKDAPFGLTQVAISLATESMTPQDQGRSRPQLTGSLQILAALEMLLLFNGMCQNNLRIMNYAVS